VNDKKQQLIKGPHRWQKGESGNPAGRPVSSRNKIAEALLVDISEVWAVHGRTVLERLARDEPAKLATIAYGLLPRDIFVRVEDQTSGIAGDDRRMLLDLLGVVKDAGAEAGSPELVFQWIAEDLRARLALPIQQVQPASEPDDNTDKGSN
jgi:hypothetical protein